jgi:tetratricopeptide (TPR) repeat protein
MIKTFKFRDYLSLVAGSVLILAASSALAAKNDKSVKENNQQVTVWNRFANDLMKVSEHYLEKYQIHSTTRRGEYGGEVWRGEGYVETSHIDKKTGQLLSRIRQQNKVPNHLHSIEIFIYDKSGRLVRDYTAAYIPGFRNAPIQTLINFHKHNDGLHSYRQFDASNRRIYEQCQGKYFNEPVDISLEDYEIPNHAGEIKDFLARENYRACFDGLPVSAGNYLNPLQEVIPNKSSNLARLNASHDYEQVEKLIAKLTRALYQSPKNPKLYLKRGDAYLLIRDTEKSIADYSNAIRFDQNLDEAYFGRGMAYGRAGEIDKAIADLSIYIERNPSSSHAYTKRGVRKIWAGKLTEAEKDLEKAVELDPGNSEAHDDLGVLYAQKKDYQKAKSHFLASIKHDPSYQKAHHNLAMVYFITENNSASLQAVNNALRLSANNRNSLLLKSEILKAMGNLTEAKKIQETAEFLPKGNWSEQFEIH